MAKHGSFQYSLEHHEKYLKNSVLAQFVFSSKLRELDFYLTKSTKVFFNLIMESTSDIRLRGICNGTGGLGSLAWRDLRPAHDRYRSGFNPRPKKSAQQERIESYRDRDGRSLCDSYYAITPEVMKYLYPNYNPRHTYGYHVCKRLGIPYSPEYELKLSHRGDDDSDKSTDSSVEIADSDDVGECSNPNGEVTGTVPAERETWILDAEYLENSYLMNGNPDPESLAWNIDPYESAWASVGLILSDEAFKHVSELNWSVILRHTNYL